MKLANKLAAILIIVFGSITLTAPHAVAATPYWANTLSNDDSYGITVYWCSGGSGVIPPGGSTTKNVCGVLQRPDRYLGVWVRETGTLLINRTNCGSKAKRINFTTSSDTRRTALVNYFDGGCA